MKMIYIMILLACPPLKKKEPPCPRVTKSAGAHPPSLCPSARDGIARVGVRRFLVRPMRRGTTAGGRHRDTACARQAPEDRTASPKTTAYLARAICSSNA